jgi:shikimate dehydrogenase
MGLPVSHSLSPHIHNAAFQAAGVNAVYIPFEVRDVGSFLKRMINPRTREIEWNVRGISVTAPHKRAVMDHLDWIEPAAQEIGAVNTIVVAEGALHGYNTDAGALIRPLIQTTGELRALRCAVIGAGGAASAALWCIRHQGSTATVFGRNIDKARALAQRFGFASENLNGASFDGFDVVINATPLGTAGQLQDKTAATNDQLRGARLAYDLVYNPIETRFSREARQAGCETLGGLSMLLAQAAEQFRLWTAVEAPEDVMSAAAARALADDRLNRRLQSEARPNSGSEIRSRESKTANGQ